VSEAQAVGFAEAEQLLLEAEFKDCRTLWYSSNYVYLAQLETGAGQVIAAVYKPHRGESPLWDFPDGLYKREAAAYRFSQLLGWSFIPPTVVRDGPHGIGSVQLFISHNEASHFFEQREDPELVPQLKRIAVFDYAANNADRKGGHCLLDEQGRIWGIDHGLCFHEQYKMRTVIWDWADEPIPDAFLADLECARAKIEALDDEAGPFLELISKAERTQVLTRSAKLVADRKFPTPGPHRSYPWPLV
jgi:Phosphatidylinositol 3- and 4-kinase